VTWSVTRHSSVTSSSIAILCVRDQHCNQPAAGKFPHSWTDEHPAGMIWPLYVFVYTTPWVKKHKTPNSCPRLCQIRTDLQNSFTNTPTGYLQQNYTDPITSLRCRYITLWNISFQKLHRPKLQQCQTKYARRTHWRECDHSRWGTKTSHKLIVQHKKTLLKNWLKQTAMQDSAAQSSWWVMLASFGSPIKG